MTTKNWRDDPSIVWQDEDGGRCLRVAKSPTGWSVTIGNPGHTLHAWAPGAYRSEVAERFLAALGLTADNLRLAPEPIKVGDRVRYSEDGSTYTVLATDGDEAWCRYTNEGGACGASYSLPLADLTRVDSSPSPEPERKVEDVIAAASAAGVIGAGLHPAPSPSPEVGEGAEPHESEDPEELAAAVAAGLMVNPRPPGADWRGRQTYDRRVGAFREALDYGFRYRIWGTVPGYGETGGAS